MKLISSFLTIQNQLRIFHWQTSSYAQHKAFGKAYEDLDGLVDDFLEVYMGKYGIVKANIKYNVSLDNYSDNCIEFIDSSIIFLNSIVEELNIQNDTDLINIRDEMLAVLNKLKYLLNLS